MQDRARILTVDDDRLLRMTIRMALEDEGYAVDTASNVALAMDCLDRCRYELVLTDLQLPDGDGLEIVRYALQLDPAAKVILMTASEEDLDTDEALRAGAIEVLFKSCRFSQLVTRARRALDVGGAEVDAG